MEVKIITFFPTPNDALHIFFINEEITKGNHPWRSNHIVFGCGAENSKLGTTGTFKSIHWFTERYDFFLFF